MAFSTSPNFSTAGGGKSLDPRLLDILKTAAASYGLDVQAFSGVAGRSTGTTNHPGGYAVDIKLVDPKTGQVLPDYQNAESFPAYQKFAETARAVQQQKYPELGNTFRWGGYFSGGPNPMDLMHFDINPTMNGAMGGGSWANGPTAEFRKQWGLPDTGTAIAAIDQIAPTPMMRPASALGYVPQAPAPLGSMLGGGSASGPAPVSGVASLSAPQQTQNLFATGSPMSQSQVAEIYKGILPTPPASLADAMQARFGNVTPSSSAASTYGNVAMNGAKPSWLPSVVPTPPRAPAPVDAMAQQILALKGMGPSGWAAGSGAQQTGSGASGSSSLNPKPSWLPSTIPTPPQASPSPMSRPASLSSFPNGSTINVHADGTQNTVPLAGSVAMPAGVRPNVPALPSAPQINPAFTAWQAQYGGLPTGTSQDTVSEKFDGGNMGSVPPTPPVVPPAPPRYLPQAPTPMSRPSSPAPSAGGSYTIRYGDTLNSIAAQTGIPVATLAAANGISDPNKIYAGQSLNLSGAPRAPSPGGSVPTAPSPMSMPARSSGNGSSSSSSSSSSSGTIRGSSTGANYNLGQVYQTPNGDRFTATPGGFVRI